MTTIRQALILAAADLTGHIAEPVRIDAEILLGHALGWDRTELHRRGNVELTRSELARFQDLIDERASGRPVAHILGEWEFYGLTLSITPDVLIPRPETEQIVDVSIERLRRSPSPRILDLGTGSGCLPIALADQLPGARIVATDISPEALAVAESNVKRHGFASRIELRHGDLLEAAPERFDLVVSNPPYVADGDPGLAPDVERYEPHLALRDVRDHDGLGFYRAIAREVRSHLLTGGFVLVEVGDRQASQVRAFFENESFVTEVHRDLAGIERIVEAR
ncbi:MAG: peptide chain release factor N(5)-glutamine methyltransferase [Planctomycetes bacterium]|nr:peptide chain release factor N(5)-glutamine methyltransferase [Planctomycetota bacterium]